MGTITGTIAGGIYFWLTERSIAKESNCQYLAPWTTDLIAWVGGAFLIYKGYQFNDGWISLVGSTVASVHVAQFAAHKVITNRKLGVEA